MELLCKSTTKATKSVDNRLKENGKEKNMDQEKKRKVSVAMVDGQEQSNSDMAAEEIELSEEESKQQMRVHEEDFIQGLIEAAGYAQNDTQRIEIVREGKLYFAFTIRPLSEDEYDRCKKKWTKYVRNKQFGMKLPEETNSVKYRDALIYTATIKEDQDKLWDNKRIWEALRDKGLQILSGLDVIEYCLKAGEKDKVLECIDSLSGYENNLEEVAKN